MGDRRHCWLVVVLSVLAWMDVAVAIVPIVASMVFGIIRGYLLRRLGWVALACDEHVFFFEYVDASFCED